ncbi:MAG: MFS transporter [Alphaproteobacteria bacterium]|nr:MFS transporter [Alphaproteobacteria bacterium]
MPLLIRLVANPLVSALADRYLRPGHAIALLSAVACAGFGALFLVSGFWPTALVLAATSLAWGPLLPISDALAARVQRRGGSDYGRMRLWGSIAFVVAKSRRRASRRHLELIGGAWRDTRRACRVGRGRLVSAACAAARQRARRSAVAGAGTRRCDPYAPSFLIVIAAVGLVQASHAAYYAFSALYWSQAGLGRTQVGLLWGLVS